MKKQEKNPKPGSFSQLLQSPRRIIAIHLQIEQRTTVGTVLTLGQRMVVYNLTSGRRLGQELLAEVDDLIAAVEAEFGEVESMSPPEAE